jgi:hypothetical protein
MLLSDDPPPPAQVAVRFFDLGFRAHIQIASDLPPLQYCLAGA